MSTMKKIGALIMALAMCFALAMPAFAAGGDTKNGQGTITVSNAVATETYTAYKIFDASPDGNGNDSDAPTATTGGNVGYTATEAQKTWWEDPANGADGLFDFEKAGDGSYIVTAQGDAKAIAEFFNNNLNTIIAAGVVDAPVTLENGTASVPYGYYFVKSNTGSVVSIDTTNKDVKIEDKNDYGDPFKPDDGENPDGQLKDVWKLNDAEITYTDTNNDGKVDTTPVDVKIGNKVTYRVSTATTNYVVEKDANDNSTSKKVSYVYITDTLQEGLTLDTASLKVYLGDDKDHMPSDALAATDYTYNHGDNTFTVVFRWQNNDGEFLHKDGTVVTLTYDATVNDKINTVNNEGKPADNAKNNAAVSYDSVDEGGKPDPDPNPQPGEGGEKTTTTTSTVGVYTYGLAIKKVDTDGTTTLPGAHFSLKNGEAGADLTFELKDGVYYYKEGEGTTTDLVSDAKGMIVVRGVNAGTYIATETQAPAGYNLLNDSVSLESIVAGTTTTTQTETTTVYYDAEGNVTDTEVENGTKTEVTTGVVTEKAIQNGKGTELPSTGGIGTTIFYVVGGAMVIGAGVLLITKKRMAE